MGDRDLEAELLAAAEKKVGTTAVMKTGYGKDCFVLVDMLLRELGAATAADGDVKVTPTADYDWGDGIIEIKPGDILQFNKHLIHIETNTFDENDKLINKAEVWLTRPHHTAIVAEVGKNGSVTIIEQNVHPNPDKVNRNTIPKLEPGVTNEKIKEGKNTKKIKITVTGEVKFYRPILKPEKGASLLPNHARGGVWALAGFIPSQGGPQRPPGLFGTGAPTSSGPSDFT